MQQRVYDNRPCIKDVDDLKGLLIEVWCELQQSVIDSAIREWRKRLRACVRAHGGHFEHLL